ILGVDLQNRFPATYIGQIDCDLSIKTARSQQRWIEHIRSVGGGDDDNTFLRIKTVHLDQQRVKRLFTLVVAAAQTMTATAPHCINFIDKNKTRRIFSSLLEHVAHTAGANAHEHLDKIRT